MGRLAGGFLKIWVISAAVVGSVEAAPVLEPVFKDIIPTIRDLKQDPMVKLGIEQWIEPRSNVLSVIDFQSPVKNQGARGTCSYFTVTAMAESMLKLLDGGRHFGAALDLSEEWLAYTVSRFKAIQESAAGTIRADGSSSLHTLTFLADDAIVEEELMPYVSAKWTSAESGLAKQRCGHVPADRKARCLIGHRDPLLMELSDDQLNRRGASTYDPEFARARARSVVIRDEFMTRVYRDFRVPMESQVKKLLNQGVPLALDVEYFYGSWADQRAETYEISRDLDQYYAGIVGYPENGSLDRRISTEEGKHSAHAVLVVGYDDEAVVTTRLKMEDGSMKEFTRKGVYYFKNSWGIQGWASRSKIEGRATPGYGMISQDYAHEYGSFYSLPLK